MDRIGEVTVFELDRLRSGHALQGEQFLLVANLVSSRQRTLLVGIVFALLAALLFRSGVELVDEQSPASPGQANASAGWDGGQDIAMDAGWDAADAGEEDVEDGGLEDVLGVPDAQDDAAPDTLLPLSSSSSPVSPRVAKWLVDDRVVGYRETTLDREERLIETRDFIGAGADGRWLTTDDAIGSRAVYEYQGAVPMRAVHYFGAGPDGQWVTEDDLISHYRAQELLGDRVWRQVLVANPGNDGMWLTADDQPARYTTGSYLASGELATERHIDHAGADGRWFSDDDHVAYERHYRYEDGRLREVEVRHGPGADGTWGTRDDTTARYWQLHYDAIGSLLRTVQFVHDAGDDRWHTGDDIIGAYSYDSYSNGVHVQHTRVDGPGPDGKWFNDDDIVIGYVSAELDDQGEIAIVVWYGGPGQDNRWFTSDDTIVAIDETSSTLVVSARTWDSSWDRLWLSSYDLLSQLGP